MPVASEDLRVQNEERVYNASIVSYNESSMH